MQISTPWRNWHPSRMQIVTSGLILAAIIAYFSGLHVLDGRAKTYFEELRNSDPGLYLNQLRESRGFATYVEEYTAMEDYGSVHLAAPSFLVGRWTMRAEPLRLLAGTAPATCINPVTFDYGYLLMPESGAEPQRVTYRIDGQKVILDAGSEGAFDIALVSYGARLDHIEFQLPGTDEAVYAYNCGR